jgi:hypothetical protein
MTLEHDLLQLARDAMRSLMNGREFGTGQTGYYLNIIRRIEDELSRSEQDWDLLQATQESLREHQARIKELEAQLAANGKQGNLAPPTWLVDAVKAATAPPRKEWVGLTSEDWENTPDTGKQGCERDAELFDWIEQTLKDKNEPSR